MKYHILYTKTYHQIHGVYLNPLLQLDHFAHKAQGDIYSLYIARTILKRISLNTMSSLRRNNYKIQAIYD